MPCFNEVANCDRAKSMTSVSGLGTICCALRAGCCAATVYHQRLCKVPFQGLHKRILGVGVEAGHPSGQGLASKIQPSVALLALHIESWSAELLDIPSAAATDQFHPVLRLAFSTGLACGLAHILTSTQNVTKEGEMTSIFRRATQIPVQCSQHSPWPWSSESTRRHP